MRWFALFWCLLLGLSSPLKAEQLPEMRPALIGSGPRSLVDMINTERLMKRGQKDAMIMFTAPVGDNGQCPVIFVYRGTPDSDTLADEVMRCTDNNNVVFIPALYNHKKHFASVSGTIIYRVKEGKPHLRIFLNQESDRILRGEDFIAPQPVWIDDGKHQYYNYPAHGYSATVVVRITVDASGKLQKQELVFETPKGKGFARMWMSHLPEETFLPGYLNGKPIACSANYQMISASAGAHILHWQPD